MRGPSRGQGRLKVGCLVVLLVLSAGCGSTEADTSTVAGSRQARPRTDPSLAQARASAARAQMNLALARTAISSRWLLQPDGQDAFTGFTGQVVLAGVCGALLKAMPSIDRARVQRLGMHRAFVPTSLDRLGRVTATSLVKSGRRWAAHGATERPRVHGVEWWAWAHDVRHAVRRILRALGPHHQAPLPSLVHAPSRMVPRAFVEYTRLCTRPAR